MKIPCPHCETPMDESLSICTDCDELFRSKDAANPDEKPPVESVVKAAAEEEQREITHAVKPYGGLSLFIFGALIYILSRLVEATSQGPGDVMSEWISLGLMVIAFLFGAVGIYRICVQIFARK